MHPKPYAKGNGRERHGRIEGRRGVELRKARLAREPLCRHCLQRGLVRAATTIDHIIPLANGGLDVDDNCQALCQPCHDAKTAVEVGDWNSGASNHPDWLKRSAIPLTIVCGAPGSGKTTYVRNHAQAGDTIIDLDDIRLELNPSFTPWSGKEGLSAAIRRRNDMLGELSRATRGRAWFIVSAPTQGERQWWKDKLGGQMVVLDPGEIECVKRCKARGTPQAIPGVRKWYQRTGDTWCRTGKPVIGLDGWPVT